MAALAAVFAVPGPAFARPGCHTHRCAERVAAAKCSQAQPRWCVERAIITYRLTGTAAAWMRRIPGCESGWDPLAYYPGKHAGTAREQAAVIDGDISAGLYAFKPSTWRGTRYGRRSFWSAKWQSLGAASLIRGGQQNQWACK